VYDPVVKEYPPYMDKGAAIAGDPYEAIDGADLLVLVTEWKEFLNLDYKKVKKLMKIPSIIDGRNFLDKEKLQDIGFNYIGIGI